MLLLEVFMFFGIVWITSFIIIMAFDCNFNKFEIVYYLSMMFSGYNFNKFEIGETNLDLDVIFKKKKWFFNIFRDFFTKKREIKLRDEYFNKKFFISSDDRVLKEILENLILKNAIIEIMNNENIYKLEIKNKKINVTIILGRYDKYERREKMQEIIYFQIKDCIEIIEEELNKISVDILPRNYKIKRELINSKIEYINKLYYSLTISTIISFFIFSQKTDLYFMENEGINHKTYIVISYLISLGIVIALYKSNKKFFINSIKTYRLLLGNILGFISTGVLVMFTLFLLNIDFDYSEKEKILITYELLKETGENGNDYYIVIKKQDNSNVDLFKDEVNYFNINESSYTEMKNEGSNKLRGYITKGKGFFNKEYIMFD